MNIKRRSFLKALGIGTAAAVISPSKMFALLEQKKEVSPELPEPSLSKCGLFINEKKIGDINTISGPTMRRQMTDTTSLSPDSDNGYRSFLCYGQTSYSDVKINLNLDHQLLLQEMFNNGNDLKFRITMEDMQFEFKGVIIEMGTNIEFFDVMSNIDIAVHVIGEVSVS